MYSFRHSMQLIFSPNIVMQREDCSSRPTDWSDRSLTVQLLCHYYLTLFVTSNALFFSIHSAIRCNVCVLFFFLSVHFVSFIFVMSRILLGSVSVAICCHKLNKMWISMVSELRCKENIMLFNIQQLYLAQKRILFTSKKKYIKIPTNYYCLKQWQWIHFVGLSTFM